MNKFDLNIEEILENWDMHHAIREIISNALDEQLLTKTKDIEIIKHKNHWTIRDFGRGIKYTHLTQKENKEKLLNTEVIGKFGIGLKDALATFDRRGVAVTAKSKHALISIEKSPKQGFDDISTLHAIINDSTDTIFIGTEFELQGVSDKDIQEAKNLFLKFSGEKIIETTDKGQVIKRNGDCGNIYINGVKVAEEQNFLFSYNITALSTSIKKALNRERSNVGRSAYTESIKKILLSLTVKKVAEVLAKDLKNISKGTAHDELSWIDVQEHSIKILNKLDKYLFMSSTDEMQYPDMIERAKDSDYEIITIPENLSERIKNTKDISGDPIIDIGRFISDYNDSFEFKIIDPNKLNKNEKIIYQQTPKILNIFGGQPKIVANIKISSTMQNDLFSKVETLGCWDKNTNSIIISRKTLRTISDYAGTLIHELIHAKTGNHDITREFEISLTEVIGDICRKLLEQQSGSLASE